MGFVPCLPWEVATKTSPLGFPKMSQKLPPGLLSNEIAFWVLRVLSKHHGMPSSFEPETVFLSAIYHKVERWLKLDITGVREIVYDSADRAVGSKFEHQIRFALTGLHTIGFVSNTAPGRGGWAISDRGKDFLQPLDADPDQSHNTRRPPEMLPAKLYVRSPDLNTVIQMTETEKRLQNQLKKLLSDADRPPPADIPGPKPPNWPTEPFTTKKPLPTHLEDD